MKKIMVYVLSIFFIIMAVSTIMVPCVSADYVTGRVTVRDMNAECGGHIIVFRYESDLTDVRLTEAIIDFTGTNVKVVSLYESICASPQPLILSKEIPPNQNQKVRVKFVNFYPGESAALYLELGRYDNQCCYLGSEDYEGGKVELTFRSSSGSIFTPTIAYFRQGDCGILRKGCAEATFRNPPLYYPYYRSYWLYPPLYIPLW